jgi:hypothetical protein
MLDRRRVALGGVAVALVALLALAITAVHAAHAVTRLTSAPQSDAARASNAYFACLEVQAHSLIVPGDVVYLLRPTLAQWVTMTKVIGGWADVTLDLGAANTAARLEHVRAPGTCDGTDIQIIRKFGNGRVLIEQGLPAGRSR